MNNPKILQVRHSVTGYKVKLTQTSLRRLKDLESIAKESIGRPLSVGAVFNRALVALMGEWMEKLLTLKENPEDFEDFIASERHALYRAARE